MLIISTPSSSLITLDLDIMFLSNVTKYFASVFAAVVTWSRSSVRSLKRLACFNALMIISLKSMSMVSA